MNRYWLVALLVLGFSNVSRADEARLIEVSTFAELAIDPDLIHMNVEVWSKSATGARAQSLAAEKVKELQATLDQYKIKKEDIQTQSFTFGPEYVWENQRNQNRLVGFRSTQTLRVTLRKVDQAGKLLDALTQSVKGGGDVRAESGVNVNGIEWDSTKRDEVQNAGLAEAVKSARRKADEIAKAAGVKVKGVYRMAHQTSGSEPAPMMKSSRAEMMVASDAGSAVSAGQIKIRVNISAAYEIN